MNLDDPKLTAFALDELDEPEKSAMARAVAASPEAQRFVEETRDIAQSLKSEYAAELEKEKPASPAPLTLTDIHDDPWFWSIARPLAIAALLAICAVIAGLAVFRKGDMFVAGPGVAGARSEAHTATSPANPMPEVQAELEMPANVARALPSSPPAAALKAPMFYSSVGATRGGNVGSASAALAKGGSISESEPVKGIDQYEGIRAPSGSFNTATYDRIEENPFLDAATNPLSTFSIDVDTASYSNIRRFINDGSLPPKDAVRIEEMINYFDYDYVPPTDGKPFAVHIDVAGCPWEASHRLVRIGLKGREIPAGKRGPSNLVFLLDVSGSMTRPERLPLVKQAMRLLVEKLTENDRVAIVVYAGASGLALPSTTGDHKEKILSAIESLEAGGSTNGAEGIQLAYEIARKNFIKGGVNRVVLATDGDFNVGVTDQGDLIRLIQQEAKSGVFLSVLGVGTDNLKDSTMQKLADKGNGNYAYLDSLDEARKVLVQQINGTLVTIAKDVKIQVEFNPARVASYRLIGYEKRILRKGDFNNDKVDAGEIGAGHTVTALYEVVPAGAAANPAASIPPVDPLKYQQVPKPAAGAIRSGNQSDEMLTVKLRYKKPDGDKSELMEQGLVDKGAQFAQASPDLKFAAAVAEFGMILRDSNYKGNGTLSAVLAWAQEGKGADTNGYRAGFIGLVRKARAVRKG
jgi:Ca-activated chloride channel family protein